MNFLITLTALLGCGILGYWLIAFWIPWFIFEMLEIKAPGQLYSVMKRIRDGADRGCGNSNTISDLKSHMDCLKFRIHVLEQMLQVSNCFHDAEANMNSFKGYTFELKGKPGKLRGKKNS